MNILIDIDGTLCHEREAWWEYDLCVPLKGSKNVLQHLKSLGHSITLFTSRFETDRPMTEEWLQKHGYPYDQIIFGKPRADMYIDNLSMKMEDLVKLLHMEGKK